MKKGGLVTSLRGAQGGYVLSKKPSDMSVADILEALDGPFLPLSQEGLAATRNGSKSDRLLSQVWKRVYQAERDVLSAITVEELARQHRQLEQQRTLMYHI